MPFVLIFDIPRTQNALLKRVNRMLKRIEAKRIQFSVWSSPNLEQLIEIALFIRRSGGQAQY